MINKVDPMMVGGKLIQPTRRENRNPEPGAVAVLGGHFSNYHVLHGGRDLAWIHTACQ